MLQLLLAALEEQQWYQQSSIASLTLCTVCVTRVENLGVTLRKENAAFNKYRMLVFAKHWLFKNCGFPEAILIE